MIASNTSPEVKINRREFLYYIWGASAVLLLAEGAGAALWFASKHLRLGVDLFTFKPSVLPLAGTPPILFSVGRFWLSNTKQGLFAFSVEYPFRHDAHYGWSNINERFECPACGSKFQTDGIHISGPAARDLDRFIITVQTPQGQFSTPSNGGPVSVDEATTIDVDVTQKILGTYRYDEIPYYFYP